MFEFPGYTNYTYQMEGVWFLDLPGSPRIGFASGLDQLWRTSDGGVTWHESLIEGDPAGSVTDIAFKDNLMGWASGVTIGVIKTTDGGITWNYSNGGQWYDADGIFYNKSNGGLFVSTWGGSVVGSWGGWNVVSWDEGSTWTDYGVNVGGVATGGFAFADGENGLLARDSYSTWFRTTDGGHLWSSLGHNDSSTLQPLAIPGSKTYFALTGFGSFMRTDDAGDSWKKLNTFVAPPNWDYGHVTHYSNSRCVRGSLDSLFVLVSTGAYLSTDQGVSWKHLCGQPTELFAEERFYVRNNQLYIITAKIGSPANYTVWRLNLDSLRYFETGLRFDDGSKLLNTVPGTVVTVNFRAQENPEVGVGAAHFVFHYDSSLELISLNLPPSWTIIDSSTTCGSLNLTIEDRDSVQLTNSIITLKFRTVLASSSAKVFVDTARLEGKRLNCDCLVSSNVERDFVTINFIGCGDSTLAHFMATGSPFRIERVVPNPAQSELRVEGRGLRVEELEVYDVMGRRVATTITTPRPRLEKAGEVILDVRRLPDGMYYLRSGQATARFEILR